MPKVKRFKNPLKSAHGPYNASGQSSSSAPPVGTPAIEPLHAPANTSIADEVPQQEQTSTQPSNSIADEVPQQEQTPTQPSNSSATSLLRSRRESTQYWRVEAIDSNNATKHINVKINEVNNLPVGERIIVDFDNYGATFGEAQGLLAGYCGLLAIDGNFFPINFDRWSGPSGVPKKYKDDCFETILKARFFFRTADAISYRYCNASLNKKWATHRQRLWDEFFDPAKSRNELLSNVPEGINRDQWTGFVAYRLRRSTIELCTRNREIRSKQRIPHTCGSKSISRRRHELNLETGQYPSRERMFMETHKRNDEARTIVDQIESTQFNAANESGIFPDDIIGKLFGAEHSGRVRCMGMGAAPSNTFTNIMQRLGDLNFFSSSATASSTTSTYLHQKVTRLEYNLEGTLAAMKAYLIAKEGRIPEEFAGLFAPEPQPSEEERAPTSPANVTGASYESNVDRVENT